MFQVINLCLLRAVVIGVWIISACCGIPNLLFYDTVTLPTGNGTSNTFCINLGQFNGPAYNVSNFVLGYALPLILMCGLYTKISMVLWKTSKVPASKPAKIRFSKRPPTQPQFNVNEHEKVRSTEKMSYYTNGNRGRSMVGGLSSPGAPGAGGGGTDDDSCYEDEQSRLVHIVPPVTKTTNNGVEDYEDDWPGSKQQISKQETSDFNGLRLHCRNKQLKLLASAKMRLNKLNRTPPQSTEGALVARRRVIRLLIAVIASFAACVLPYHIRIMWQTFHTQQLAFSFWEILFTPITFVAYYMNSALNPLLYAFLSMNFRRSLCQVLTCRDKMVIRHQPSSQSYSRTTNTTI